MKRRTQLIGWRRWLAEIEIMILGSAVIAAACFIVRNVIDAVFDG
ncbi:hypothetical protein [Sphingomonas sp. GM_Shp_2]|nr:hypothetical protein [Sphingomonas sp. GM_Shp_2]